MSKHLIILLLSLLIGLSSSSFSLLRYIDSSLKQHNVNPRLIHLGERHGIVSALLLKKNQAEKGSNEWLHYSHQLANTDIDSAIELAEYYQQIGQVNDAKLWLNPHLPTNLAKVVQLQANLLATEGQLDEAFSYLAHHNELMYRHQTIKLAIDLGKVSYIENGLKAERLSQQSLRLLKRIGYFDLPVNVKNKAADIEMNHDALNHFIGQSYLALQHKNVLSKQLGECRSVTFFTTTIADFKKVKEHIKKLKSEPFINYLCFEKVRYIPITWLDCQLSKEMPILCNDHIWSLFSQQTQSHYLAVLLPEGGANVHQGLLYFDRTDTYQVLAHELAHLVGFVDEYPVRPDHSLCENVNRAVGNNLVVLDKNQIMTRKALIAILPWGKHVKSTTPLWHTYKGKLILGTPDNFINDIGLFMSESCQNSVYDAFKPLKQQTIMRYFEQPMPAFYLELLKTLGDRYYQPNFTQSLLISYFGE